MALDKETVRRIARLAHIEVKEAELDGLARELAGILAWVEKLNAVDTKDIAPMTGAVEMSLPMREDAVTEGGQAEKVLANAPDRVHGFFAVPKVVE